MIEYEGGVSPARLRKGMADLTKRCHCGKLRINHSIPDARICKKEQETEYVVTRMTDKEIQNGRYAKI